MTTGQAQAPATTAVDRWTRRLLAGGVIGPPLFILVFLIEGATRPGYSAWRTFVSLLDLSNQGWEQDANFIVCGVLCTGFAVGLRRALRSSKGATWGPLLVAVFGLGLVAAGIFVTGPGQGYPPGAAVQNGPGSLHAVVHALAGLVCFTTLPAATFVLARRFAGDPAWRGWAAYSIATGVTMLVSFGASLVVGSGPNAPAGLLQRIAIVAGWAWIALLAYRLLSGSQSSNNRRVSASYLAAP